MPVGGADAGERRAKDAPVCVTGMHRSGTSLLAGMLGDLGIDMGAPDEMITPDMFGLPVDDQPGGYHENVRFVRLDDAILERLGGDTYHVPEPEPGRALSPALDDERRQARELVAELETRRPWGWKDPRSLVLLDFWTAIIPNLRVVLCVRNPIEVARSIAARGETKERDALAWWSTCYRVGVPLLPPSTLVVAHDRLVVDPASELRRLVAFLGHEVEDDRLAAAASRFDARLHRQRVAPAPQLLPDDIRAQHERLAAWAGEPASAVARGANATGGSGRPDAVIRDRDSGR
jgi:hypothetical protein